MQETVTVNTSSPAICYTTENSLPTALGNATCTVGQTVVAPNQMNYFAVGFIFGFITCAGFVVRELHRRSFAGNGKRDTL